MIHILWEDGDHGYMACIYSQVCPHPLGYMTEMANIVAKLAEKTDTKNGWKIWRSRAPPFILGLAITLNLKSVTIKTDSKTVHGWMKSFLLNIIMSCEGQWAVRSISTSARSC